MINTALTILGNTFRVLEVLRLWAAKFWSAIVPILVSLGAILTWMLDLIVIAGEFFGTLISWLDTKSEELFQIDFNVLETTGGLFSDIFQAANTFVPIDTIFAVISLCLVLKIIVSVIRIIVSLIPTVGG